MKMLLIPLVCLFANSVSLAETFDACVARDKAMLQNQLTTELQVPEYVALYKKLSSSLSAKEKVTMAWFEVQNQLAQKYTSGQSSYQWEPVDQSMEAWQTEDSFTVGLETRLLKSIGSRLFTVGKLDYHSSPINKNHSIKLSVTGHLELCYETIAVVSANDPGTSISPLLIYNKEVIYSICIFDIKDATQVFFTTYDASRRNESGPVHVKKFIASRVPDKCNGF